MTSGNADTGGTARKEKLLESEPRFRCLVEDAAVAIGIIDLKGRFTYMNRALAKLTTIRRSTQVI